MNKEKTKLIFRDNRDVEHDLIITVDFITKKEVKWQILNFVKKRIMLSDCNNYLSQEEYSERKNEALKWYLGDFEGEDIIVGKSFDKMIRCNPSLSTIVTRTNDNYVIFKPKPHTAHPE